MALLNPDEHGSRNVLCTNERGILTLLTPTLKTIREIPVPQQNVQLIVSADLKGDGKLAFCGLAPNEKSILVLGLTDQGDVLWKYPIALGMQEYPIEPVSAGQVLPDGPKQWLVAGCDGSIHFLSGEGKVIDHFNYGARCRAWPPRGSTESRCCWWQPPRDWTPGKCRSSRSSVGREVGWVEK